MEPCNVALVDDGRGLPLYRFCHARDRLQDYLAHSRNDRLQRVVTGLQPGIDFLVFVIDLDPNAALPLRRPSPLSFLAKVDVYQRFPSNAAAPWGKRV